eukprot:GHVR01133393.1.p1 GENE.GHVR01133393.1~~GHVR01133393.1.p1  ORF type:complete len:426 (+),score=131.22 GHVR01133393.1:35-1312(+)
MKCVTFLLWLLDLACSKRLSGFGPPNFNIAEEDGPHIRVMVHARDPTRKYVLKQVWQPYYRDHEIHMSFVRPPPFTARAFAFGECPIGVFTEDIGNNQVPTCVALEYFSKGDIIQFNKSAASHGVASPGATSDERRTIALQSLTALHYLHVRGYTHGDIKTRTLSFNSMAQVGITDFTLTRRGSEFVTTTTPNHLSPEIIRGKGGGPMSDIFSLGVVLFRLCHYLQQSPVSALPFFDRADITMEELETAILEGQRVESKFEECVWETKSGESVDIKELLWSMLHTESESRITAEAALSFLGYTPQDVVDTATITTYSEGFYLPPVSTTNITPHTPESTTNIAPHTPESTTNIAPHTPESTTNIAPHTHTLDLTPRVYVVQHEEGDYIDLVKFYRRVVRFGVDVVGGGFRLTGEDPDLVAKHLFTS